MGHIALLRHRDRCRMVRIVARVAGAIAVILGGAYLIGWGIPEAVLQCVFW